MKNIKGTKRDGFVNLAIIALGGLIVFLIIIFAAVKLGSLAGWGISPKNSGEQAENNVIVADEKISEKGASQIESFKKFASDEEFKNYFSQSAGNFYGRGGGISDSMIRTLVAPEMKEGAAQTTGVSAEPERISETNVQVAGIDEPDILKTNGKEIYFSPQKNYYRITPMGMGAAESVVGGITREKIAPFYYQEFKTSVIQAFPADKLGKLSEIKKAGDLLLAGKNLVVFENKDIYGYDVSDPANPKEKWAVNLDDRNEIVQARLFGGKIYLISRKTAGRSGPCPIPLYKIGENEISVRCMDVYRPSVPTSSDAVYNVSVIDPATGAITPGISFVGSYDSTVYMSANALYVAYASDIDAVEFSYDFLNKNSGLVPSSVTEKLKKLLSYEISKNAKTVEMNEIMNEHASSLPDDERLKFENEIQNRVQDYLKERKRDLRKTDIVKIGVSNFKIMAHGKIPGQLLNQFSLDEYEKKLRAAVTVGGGFWGGGFGGSTEQENDVYVLDDDLNIAGAAKGLGKDERIYSARFIGNRGYIVTFKQTDPFFVLDLSDAKNPKMSGELKITGYSSYLHPIAENRILGVGKEGSQVKISLFDVSSAENPKEAAKYTLKEYWSDVLNTHHAFLADAKHQIFFLPGSTGGYVFSYINDELKLTTAVSGISARRAVFIDDYLYIVGDNKIIVLDENSWKKSGELELPSK